MPELSFRVEGVEAIEHAAAPQLMFKLHITNDYQDELIHSVALTTQIQIDAVRRRYNEAEKERLFELFDDPKRWSQTLRSMLWTHVNVTVPPFRGNGTAEIPVPCTFDFNVSTTKYFYSLEEGEVPLLFLFSGTVFYKKSEDEPLQIAQISWEKEAKFRLPVRVWKEMMNIYYPNSTWLRIQHDVFDRLYRYKIKNGLPTWERVIENLLPDQEEVKQ